VWLENPSDRKRRSGRLERDLVVGRETLREEGRGRGSGVEIDAPLGVVDDLRHGKVSRVRAYLDHGEALRAAGLEG
jgi:hypothetical protein